jgi:CheY-like chemotaxis protein
VFDYFRFNADLEPFAGLPAQTEKLPAVLLVDDDEQDAALVKRAFERAGLQCPFVRVASGLEAMAYLSGQAPYHDESRYPRAGLILLDIRMPGVDGFEVLRWIRHNPILLGLPVVMLTGSNEIHDATKAYQLGATSFFVKPYDFANYAALSRTIQHFITC